MGLARDAAEAEARNCYDVIERLRAALKVIALKRTTAEALGDHYGPPLDDCISIARIALKEGS
jgi:hypothetical protein